MALVWKSRDVHVCLAASIIRSPHHLPPSLAFTIMITRAGNATKRPGEVQIRSSLRRPKQVVQAERAAKAAEKEKAATAKDTAIEKLVRLEQNARKKVNVAKPKEVRSGDKVIGRTSTSARKALSAADKGEMATINKP